MPLNVLFISHDASRTGAPMVLLHLLQWLKGNSQIQFSVLLKKGGEMEKEFQALAPTYFWEQLIQPVDRVVPIVYPQKSSLKRRISSFIKGTPNPPIRKIKERPLESFVADSNFDLIYANSVASADIIIALRAMIDIPVICHIHELEFAIKHACGEFLLKQANTYISKYIAVAESVKQNLVSNHNLDPAQIELVYEFIPAKSYYNKYKGKPKADLRKALGFSENAFIVCSSGTIDWRKGTDLFVQLARQVIKQSTQEIVFIWIGANCPEVELDKIHYDINKLELENQILLIGQKTNATDYLAISDVFALMSREDPFPLVCLESASMGIPIVCFSNSGGMPEFVNNDSGILIPYLDVPAMAQSVISLMEDPEKTKKLGEAAAQKAITQCDVEVSASKLSLIITELANTHKNKFST